MKKNLIFCSMLFLLWMSNLYAFSTSAKTALVIDDATNEILLSKNIDIPIPPASMSKLMTLWMVFESLDQGKLRLGDTFRVSKKAWKKGGSKMFLREGEIVTVEDLLRGVIIQSGNDACIVLAEGLAGTEENFAELMTIRAKEIGLNNSNFVNSTGWPDPNHKMTSRDLVNLAIKIREKFPSYYKIFNELDFTWDGISQRNRNPLLTMNVGADGLKTGYTQESGYGLIASVKQGKRRITFVITGLKSVRQRAREAKGITTWAFTKYKVKTLFKKNSTIIAAPIWRGNKDTIQLTSPIDVEALTVNKANNIYSAKIVLSEPLKAPIKKGELLKGNLVIETEPILETTLGTRKLLFPLVANETVIKGGWMNKIKTNFMTLRNNFFKMFGTI